MSNGAPRGAADAAGLAEPPGCAAATAGTADAAPAAVAEPAAGAFVPPGSVRSASAETAETVPVDGEATVSFKEEPGLVGVTVRYAHILAWSQRTVYISPECNSDQLKWGLRNHLGGSVSTWRVHDGFRGHPYDRFRPIVSGPENGKPEEAMKGPVVIAQSFGP